MKFDSFQKFYKTIHSFFLKSPHTKKKTNRKIAARLIKFAEMPVNEVLQSLETSELGLYQKEVHKKLKQYGPNEIAHDKPPTWYSLLFRNFTNPFVALLLGLGVLSYFLGEADAAIIISFMLIISILMRFIQEYRSNKAAEKLQALVSTTATVLRRNNGHNESKSIEINIKFLVPGDIIRLSAGDMIPADVRLISAKELFVSQSSLTGESMPIEKDESFQPDKSIKNPIELPNMCFMGTNVVNGSALAVIINTGNDTYFGSIAEAIAGERPLTSFDLGVNKVSWLLIRLMFLMVPLVFILNGLTKGDWFEAFLFALSVAVGLTPEMLPMIVTANLARGAIQMSQHKVIVKRLNAIQNFGAMNILCTDKTGTLTQDRIILENYLDAEGEESEEVLQYAYLNSYYQTGLKNQLDIAVLEHKLLETELKLNRTYKKVDELPFDFNRRRMSVVVEKSNHGHLLICKGAVEEILTICTKVQYSRSLKKMSDALKEKLDLQKRELNEDGLRVLAVAYKEFPHGHEKEYRNHDEAELTFLGFLAFLDPPKHSTHLAIAKLEKHNVQVKVLTGDNELVTQKICRWVKLPFDKVLIGDQIDNMSDSELKKAVDQTTIFAKLCPMQKTRIIAALKSNGHIVGYLGDGINDAAALREADIGISVDTAVDIAKESADIIMLEKNLSFLGEGVIEGRQTFGNIIKYIKMAVSSNFGNVFSIVGASVLFPFLPMKPIQLLTQNLLYDTSQVAIPFDNVDEEFLSKPRKWDAGGIVKFMLFIGPISSIFDYITFAVLWFVFSADSLATQALFQSGWFVEGLLSQTLIVHMIRTQKIPFFQSIASLPLLLTTAAIMAIGIYIPYSYIGQSIGLVPLPAAFFYWLTGILLSYCLLTQVVKMWFIKRYNYWL